MIPYATSLARAGCQICVNLGLVPSDTVAIQNAINDTTLSVASGVNFWTYSALSFWDGTDEKPAMIASGQAPQIGLQFAGRPYTGLQFVHPVGSLVASNIFPWPLGDNSNAWNNGYPVIGCYVLDDTTRPPNSHQYQDFAMLTFCYTLPEPRPSANALDSQLWIGEHLDRAEQDIQILQNWLQINFRMPINGVAHCEEVVQFVKSRRHNVTDSENPTFELLLDVQIKGLHVTI